ncbi:hypothetical protein [Streptomyces sp. DH24]|uniref:hypothetical protein n=1 Tax=Streptomyces sp. DH24 TaxID=3040123 RepID=UPI00244355F6|nr:hypothetical protein [Streptomyces sp. DH24]
MTRLRLVLSLGSLARILLSVAGAAVLLSCSSNEPVPKSTATPTSVPSSASATSTAPAASPTPSMPVATDGKDVRACADGTCEIRVSPSARVPLPARLGLGPLQVTAIQDGTVAMFAPLIQSEFASDGGCSAAITGPGAGDSGSVGLTCSVGEKAVVNKMSLEVVGIDTADQAAVLRIRPAK